MDNESKLNLDSQRAAHAKRLLEDELLIEGFQKLQSDLLDWWKNRTGPEDAAAREKIWQAYQLAGKLPDWLQKVISDGKLADRELQLLQAKAARKAA